MNEFVYPLLKYWTILGTFQMPLVFYDFKRRVGVAFAKHSVSRMKESCVCDSDSVWKCKARGIIKFPFKRKGLTSHHIKFLKCLPENNNGQVDNKSIILHFSNQSESPSSI